VDDVSTSSGADGHTLTGQVALITGGGRGIGRAIAEGVSAAGAAVAVLARSKDELLETVGRIEQAGGRALAIVADVTNRQAVQCAVEQTERELGPIDLLVNNAAVVTPIGPAWVVDPVEWWRAIEINLRGPFLCAQAIVPGMIARRSGRIVNIVAVAANRPSPFTSSYGSSKAALVRFTDTLAAEVREHGISVFALRPGTVQTTMQDQLAASPYRQPSGPPPVHVPAERAAEATVFLASGRADALTGRFIDIVRDDLTALVQRTDQIVRDDLMALRLRE
jgi:NAD(P)-dependent dehydrogenase (short-subunit alcohol dehydrogenase family)